MDDAQQSYVLSIPLNVLYINVCSYMSVFVCHLIHGISSLEPIESYEDNLHDLTVNQKCPAGVVHQ